MDGNESIVVCQSSVEIDDVLDVGVAGGIGLTLFLGSITAAGLIIKGIFIYSGASRAPKVRGGQKPNFAPLFRKVEFYCIFM